ncbi:MAG: beta-lactamase family protein [Chitinophagales bacterium]|nr:beta-lactamase family protein [Chitinophagales bacterium]
MMRLGIFLLVGILVVGCYNSTKNSSEKKVDDIQLAIEKNADSLLQDPKISAISIGIYKDGNTHIGHFGELDKGNKNSPTNSTIYEIASVSKSFTGTLVAQAVLDNKLSLEDDIRKYLEGDFSNLEYESHPITIKHLITHTAGLPRFLPTEINGLFSNIDENLPFRIYNIEKEYSKQAFLEDLQSVNIDVMPGTSYSYSNADTELVAHILENAYGLTYEQLLQQYIFEIAGMGDTKVHLSNEDINRLANGYGETNKQVPHFANTLWGAGSGLKSTTVDLLNYIAFQLENKSQAVEESHKLLYSDGDVQMGYLWPILEDADDGVYYSIHGGAFGTQNFLLILPKHNLGISIITNQSGPETQGKLLNTLNNLLIDIKSI